MPQFTEHITINLTPETKRKLEQLAELEGRNISDVIREAIAKLLRERGMIGGSDNAKKTDG